LLSHLASFREGTRIVRERASLQIDIFRSYTDKKDTHSAIEALHQYGPNEPDLYILALAYFCSDAKIMEEAGDELLTVLKKIEDDKLLTPLQIVRMLSGTGVAHLGVVKNFLAETIEKERRDIENVYPYLRALMQNRKLIEDYRRETEKKEQEINDLKGRCAFRCVKLMQCSSFPGYEVFCVWYAT
jgi:vacuolar protein sorting-associated protein 11